MALGERKMLKEFCVFDNPDIPLPHTSIIYLLLLLFEKAITQL